MGIDPFYGCRDPPFPGKKSIFLPEKQTVSQTQRKWPHTPAGANASVMAEKNAGCFPAVTNDVVNLPLAESHGVFDILLPWRIAAESQDAFFLNLLDPHETASPPGFPV
jgi:hypothetical protein